jgi:O-antigen ligase
MQYGAGPMSLLRFGPSFGGTSAAGTYTNRDHLAGLLEMMLPLAIALLLASFKSDRYQNLLGGWQKKLAALKFNAAFLWIGVAIILMLGIIFTQSRTGIFLMLLGVLLSFLVFSSHLGFKKIVNFGLVAFGVALLSALQVGLIPVLSRFFLEDPLADLRWPMAQATIEGMPYFFPWGSGVGTFGEVFQRFQTVALNGFYIDHAHNDVLEFAFEGGLLAMAVMASFFFYYLRRWWQFWPKGRWERYHFIQAGAGISIFLMMLHSLVDFNLHVPANVVYFALVVGFFFHKGPEQHAG